MTCIEDLRRVARRRVPRAFVGYLEAGAYSQETLRANRADMEKLKLRQRVLVDVWLWCAEPTKLISDYVASSTYAL